MHAMTPYCFPPAAFEAEAFRPLEFLEECQSRHPIAQVHRDLEAFKRSLENQVDHAAMLWRRLQRSFA